METWNTNDQTKRFSGNYSTQKWKHGIRMLKRFSSNYSTQKWKHGIRTNGSHVTILRKNGSMEYE
jgi:hypothetical protein